jgi:3-oxoacyl-[acyl-carrier protein] reductase
MKNLAGKYAVVTGAGRGIGASIVRKFFAEDIAGLAMLARGGSLSLCEKMAHELDPEGQRLLPVQCDVSNKAEVQAAVAKTLEKFGAIDILVNNAGITRDAMFHKMTEEQWDEVMSANLKSMFYLCHEIVPVMRKREYGKIVNISSTSALGNIGQANYAASKAAVQGFTKTLAKELGPKNITCNAIAPGYILTDMFNAVPQEILDGWKKDIPLRRFASPDEIASVACFLSSDESSFLTSQCIYVSGGTITG